MASETKRERALRLAREAGFFVDDENRTIHTAEIANGNVTEYVERLIAITRAEAFEEAANHHPAPARRGTGTATQGEAMTTKRGFLTQCLALAAAPAIVRADSLMRIVPREALILDAPRWGLVRGYEWTDITEAVRASTLSGHIISAHFTHHYIDLRKLLEA